MAVVIVKDWYFCGNWMSRHFFSSLKGTLIYGSTTTKTSRFPYIGSWCVLRTVVTQYVMASVCFQTIFWAFNFLWFPSWVTSLSVSPSHLCYNMCVTLRFVCHTICVTLYVSHYVCCIICVTSCVSHFVCHILCVTLSVSHFLCHMMSFTFWSPVTFLAKGQSKLD